jgi:DUF1680 family protein
MSDVAGHGGLRGVPAAPSAGALRPLGIDRVSLTGGFWGTRQEINRSATLHHCAQWLERLTWIANFDRTAHADPDGSRAGREFADSETYKLLEALAWESARSGDPAVEDLYLSLSSRVVAAQQPDGYLNTRFGNAGQPARYTDLEWGHELYCAGHLIQAAVARARTAGEDDLVRAARALADHVCETFGPGGIERVDGHPEIEVALMELHRVTGEHRYLEMARLFLERRGTGTLAEIEFGQGYFQDDVPVRAAAVLRGHAVRALYLSAAAVDLAVETGDQELLDALVRQWERTVARRTYITGGMGSRHQDESFGEDYELPADRAYSETCAGIASIMSSWRLLLATGDPRYADLIERTLYNVLATGPDEKGTAFFYANPLHQRTPGDPALAEVVSPRPAAGLRAPWFAVSCCPTNIARTVASLQAYLATADDEGLQLHQYAPAVIDVTLPGDRRAAVEVVTNYPLQGRVRVRATADSSDVWTLALRIPTWAAGRARVTVEGEDVPVDGPVARVQREFRRGDEVVLDLPVDARWSWPDPRIDAVRGTVAVERGPLVLCAESVDLADGLDLEEIQVLTDTPPRDGDGDTAVIHAARRETSPGPWPYTPVHGMDAYIQQPPYEVTLIPYHRWAERGPTAMRVFLPVADQGTHHT